MTEPHRGDTNFNILTSLQFLCKEGQGRWRVVLHKTRLSSPAPRESNLRGIRGDALVYRLDIRPFAKDEVLNCSARLVRTLHERCTTQVVCDRL